jgi:hypothetical protein
MLYGKGLILTVLSLLMVSTLMGLLKNEGF